MRTLVLVLALNLYSLLLPAQPGDRYISLGLYTPTGKNIDSADAHYLVSFVYTSSSQKVDYSYKNKRFLLKLSGYGMELRVGINDLVSGTAMFFNTNGSLDSIAYQPGEYKFDVNEASLFNIHPFNNTRIINRNMENFSSTVPHRFPLFYQDEELNEDSEVYIESRHCYQLASTMEDLHGGKNWIRNVCNDTYETEVRSLDETIQKRIETIETKKTNEYRTTIYPYKHGTYFRLDLFNTSKKTMYNISISTDTCMTWKTLFTITGE